jgi:hypothetical protein
MNPPKDATAAGGRGALECQRWRPFVMLMRFATRARRGTLASMRLHYLFGLSLAALAVPGASYGQQPVESLDGKALAGSVQRGGKAKYSVEGNGIVGTSAMNMANRLTPQEEAAGWRLLWDGKTSEGWRSAKSETFPAKGWEAKDGVLTVLASGGPGSAPGDIITRERYVDFELMADFKITKGANSGIKYFVQANLDPINGAGEKAAVGSAIGLEFQILDDARHPDAKAGRDGNRTIGSLYDLIPAAAAKKPNPIGEWNTARILVNGRHVEHWLNGVKLLEYERGSEAFRRLVAESKYKNIPGFGEWPDGHILLQDHGNTVCFRNLKIRQGKTATAPTQP